MQLEVVAIPAKLPSLLVKQCLVQRVSLLVYFHLFIPFSVLQVLSSFTAPLPAPTNLMAIGMTTSIRLTWEQPEGSVDSYVLTYQFTVNQCSGNESIFPPVQAIITDGSLREYTIENSSDTPVEEDSMYSSITLRAMNRVDTSELSNSATATTMTAGEFYVLGVEL